MRSNWTGACYSRVFHMHVIANGPQMASSVKCMAAFFLRIQNAKRNIRPGNFRDCKVAPLLPSSPAGNSTIIHTMHVIMLAVSSLPAESFLLLLFFLCMSYPPLLVVLSMLSLLEYGFFPFYGYCNKSLSFKYLRADLRVSSVGCR